jgi:hypothetical protein
MKDTIGWVVQNAADIVRVILILFLIIAPTAAVIYKNATGAAVLAATGAAALLFTRLPDISALTLFGLSARLQRQSEQVQVTLTQLQRLATSLAEGSLDQLPFSGVIFVGLSTREKFRIRAEIVESLKTLGISAADILKAQRGWIYFYDNILEAQLEARVKEIQPDADVENEIKRLPKSDVEDLPSPDTLREWAKGKFLNDPKVTQLLKEYNNIWTTGAIEDPDLVPFGSHPRIRQ